MKKTVSIASLLLLMRVSDAQTLKPDIVTTAGDYYNNATGSLSWTMGEPIIETYQGGSNMLTQGFQQSSYSITAVDNIDMPKLNVSVYPNPFTSILNIKNGENTPLHLVVIDMSGKTICEKNTEANQGQINLSGLSDALYLLKVYDSEGQAIQTFKIQKIN